MLLANRAEGPEQRWQLLIIMMMIMMMMMRRRRRRMHWHIQQHVQDSMHMQEQMQTVHGCVSQARLDTTEP